MRTASFGWEADNINGSGVSMTVPVNDPIILRGYQISIGLMCWNVPLIGKRWTEVLFQVFVSGLVQPIDFGAVTYHDQTGSSQNLHGNQMSPALCRAILKAYAGDQSAANLTLPLMGLDLKLNGGSLVTMTANHAGFGPVDFEAQGVLFYDNA